MKKILGIIRFLWFGSLINNKFVVDDEEIVVNRIILLISLLYHYVLYPFVFIFLIGMFLEEGLSLGFSVLATGVFLVFVEFFVALVVYQIGK